MLIIPEFQVAPGRVAFSQLPVIGVFVPSEASRLKIAEAVFMGSRELRCEELISKVSRTYKEVDPYEDIDNNPNSFGLCLAITG